MDYINHLGLILVINFYSLSCSTMSYLDVFVFSWTSSIFRLDLMQFLIQVSASFSRNLRQFKDCVSFLITFSTHYERNKLKQVVTIFFSPSGKTNSFLYCPVLPRMYGNKFSNTVYEC